MPGGLPPGLITNTETITEEIDNTERVQVEDVAKLWRVYSLNSAHMRDDEATRLENFFWRIWSNGTIIRSIRGSTLARLFITISEGGNRVRTTPVPTPLPTPLATTPTQNLTFPSAAAPRRSVATASVENREISAASSSQIDPSPFPRRTSDQSRTLAPILKKSRTGSDDPPKSARVLPPDTEVQETNTKSPRRKSTEITATISSPPSATAERSSKSASKKKTSGAATAGTRKARPAVMRKRSSQTSGATEQRRSSQTSPYMAAQSGKTTPKLALGLPPSTTGPAFALPASSWQDVESPSSSREPLDNAFSTPQQPSSWLVDKNFRGKFVEEQKRATSSINLAALGRSQSVRFLDEMPEQRRAASKGKDKAEGGGSGGGPGGSPGKGRAGRSPPLASSTATEEGEEEDEGGEEEDEDEDKDENSESEDEDGDDDEGGEEDEHVPALPRTKSQLSMLIDKDRRYSGGTNLRIEPARGENRAGEEGEKDDESEENELLVMARRDKKGKAKDPDQPFRAAAQKGLLRSGSGFNDDYGDGSGSPPPVF